MKRRDVVSGGFRFEILKRDRFTCQYCGARSPEAVLHVDHIIPVSSGGRSVDRNLVTACASCNLGKGAGLPESEPRELGPDEAARRERERAIIQAIARRIHDRFGFDAMIDAVTAIACLVSFDRAESLAYLLESIEHSADMNDFWGWYFNVHLRPRQVTR